MSNVNYRLTVTLILLVLSLVFILQNLAIVEIRFFFWSLAMSRAILLFAFVLVGFLIGWFVHGYAVHRRQRP